MNDQGIPCSNQFDSITQLDAKKKNIKTLIVAKFFAIVQVIQEKLSFQFEIK